PAAAPPKKPNSTALGKLRKSSVRNSPSSISMARKSQRLSEKMASLSAKRNKPNVTNRKKSALRKSRRSRPRKTKKKKRRASKANKKKRTRTSLELKFFFAPASSSIPATNVFAARTCSSLISRAIRNTSLEN